MSDSTVERELGTIIATLTQMQRDAQEAKETQAALTAKLDKALAVIAVLQSDMTSVKPVVEQFKSWRLVGLGAVMGIGAAGTALGITLATVREALFHALGWK